MKNDRGSCRSRVRASLLTVCIAAACALTPHLAHGQFADTIATPEPYAPVGLFPRQAPDPLKQITITGFYRFFGTYTQQYEDYVLNPVIGDTALPRSLFIGDDSQLPNLLLNVAGRPSAKASWAFDLYMFQFMQGNIGEAYSKPIADSLRPPVYAPLTTQRLSGNMLVQLGINLTGSYATPYGTFKLRTGGIHWHTLSEFTMASFRGFNRFILFEDNPWDPVGNSITTRYDTYYNTGAINQDMRWGNRAFTGVILDGTALPGGLQFSGLLGKAEINGGFSETPNYAFGGKLQKQFDRGQFISLNTMNSKTWSDSLALESVGFHLVTTEATAYLGKFRINTETGAGQYYSPLHNGQWGEAIRAGVTTPVMGKATQFNVQYYRISPHVINNIGSFLNTSINEYTVNDIPAGSVGSTAVLQPFSSAMVRLGQMTNNRQGIHLNSDFQIGKFKVGAGISASGELTPVSNQITYGHPVNQLTRSRFWRWVYPTGVGPYERYSVIFRDTYETVNLSDDSSGIAVHRKYFNVAEIQTKYATRLLNRELYVFFLGQYASAQRRFSPFIVTNEDAYIRQYVSECEIFYRVLDKVILTGYVGYERTLGNYLTDIDEETRRPRNQYGQGYGIGIDVDMGRNARLYIRNRWFAFEDTSFADDHFRGNETVVEYKIFF